VRRWHPADSRQFATVEPGPRPTVLHFVQMSSTLSVRIPDDLAKWLNHTARRTGVPKGRIVREELEKVRASAKSPFSGWQERSPDCGPFTRNGFSRK